MVDTRAEKIALREYKLSVDNPGDEGFLRCDLFSEATKKAKEEAFTTLFDDKFQNIYKQAYATTMNKVGHEDKSKDRQFRKELDIEIESCSEILKKPWGRSMKTFSFGLDLSNRSASKGKEERD